MIFFNRFLPFAIELGVVVQQMPVSSPPQPVHQMKIERTNVTYYTKNVKRHHYIITNKSEKEIELLLEHPKAWSTDPTSTSLVVEDCYFGSDKTKTPVEVKTEYPFLS